jgi:uncharacterized membrane protein
MQRIADAITEFLGTWWFIFLFTVISITWCLWNDNPHLPQFDPPPHMGGNLILSWLGVVFPAVVMISNKLLYSRDHRRDEHDYQTGQRIDANIAKLVVLMEQFINQQKDAA